MQPSDTAYPRFKTRPSPAELEQFYTPAGHEQFFCDGATRSAATRLGFVLLLKTFQRLGYFVISDQVPDAVIEHVAIVTGQRADPAVLRRYDTSEARRKHMLAARRFLEVKSFDAAGKALLCEALGEAALAKEDVADIINVGIEILVRHRYELPAFGTLVREARARRAATNQTLHRQVHLALGEAGAVAVDALFAVGDDP